MEVKDNEGGGTSVYLEAGDDLMAVPKSHRMLVTSPIRKAFLDPPAYFRQIADRCPFPSMAAWLRAVTAGESWHLALHRGPVDEWMSAGFYWFCEDIRSAQITPSDGKAASDLPPVLSRYYSLIDQVDWMGFGCGGGLAGGSDHMPLTCFDFDYYGADVELSETYVFGGSACGDMLIYTADDRGGWCCMGGRIHLLGTIEDTIEWVYAELLSGRGPEFDYQNWV